MECIILTQSKKRKRIAMMWIMALLGLFWGLSRYPDLLKEYDRAQSNTVTERSLGNLSKDEMMSSENPSTNSGVAMTTTLNWLDTNKKGMTFGILFAAAILLLLGQSRFLARHASRKGLWGICSGIVMGVPLGICTNCTTPVSLGMAKAGASYESAFATLIASPSLNPIGLIIIYMLLPLPLFVIRISALSVILLLVLPLLIYFILPKSLQDNLTRQHIPEVEETWCEAFVLSATEYWRSLKYIIAKVLLPMILLGLLAAILVALFPIQSFALLQDDSIMVIIMASFFGALLPMPMFVDIILLMMLVELNAPYSVLAALIVTLAPTSIYATYVMGRNVSWHLSLSLFLSIALMGCVAGITTKYYLVQPSHIAKNSAPIEKIFIQKIFEANLINPYDNRAVANYFSGGLSAIDFDNDGDDDLFLSGPRSLRLFQNDGNGKFTDITAKSGLSQQWNTVAGIWADYNNDGLLDVYLVNYVDGQHKPQANQLYRNQGNGKFVNVSKQLGLTHQDYSSSAAWADIDNDGDLDLYVSNYGFVFKNNDGDMEGFSAANRLYRNDGKRFVDITQQARVAGRMIKSTPFENWEINETPGFRGFSFQPIWFDYNNDGKIDLFVANDIGVSTLYQNIDGKRFKNVTHRSGLYQFNTGMGVMVTDFDNNGYFDLYVTTTTQNKLWLNDGDGRFRESSEKLGLIDKAHIGWGVNQIDWQNTGQSSVFIANGPITLNLDRASNYQRTLVQLFGQSKIYLLNQQNKFFDATRELSFFRNDIARGSATADFNQDGKVDFAMSQRRGKQMLVYQNESKLAKHYIKVKLRGKRTNRFGVGAVVIVKAGSLVQRKLVTAGDSFLSQSSYVLHFGVGDNIKIDSIEVQWPGGRKQVLKDIKADRVLEIKEKNI